MLKSTILIITTSYPISKNGSEAAGSFVNDLAESLSALHNIKIVAPGSDNSIEYQNNITVYRYSSPNSALSNLKILNPFDMIKIISVLYNGKKATARAVADGTVSHILALWALPSGFWANHYAKKRGLEYSVWTLGSDIWTLSKIPIVNRVLTATLKNAKFRFSDGIKLAKDTELLAQKTAIFLPSTRKTTTEKKTNLNTTPPFKLLFIGRWHANKGIDILMDSLKLLTDQDWRQIKNIQIYGGGPLENEIKYSVNALRQQGKPIEIFSFIPKEEAEIKITECDYVLIPSRIESIPLIFSDAMKLGKPVISTPVGDLPVLIENGAGLVSNEVNAKSYAKALIKAINTPTIDSAVISSIAKKFDLTEISHLISETIFSQKESPL